MNFIAFIPKEDGTQPVGSDKQTIIRDLKTVRGAVARAKASLGQSFVLYSYLNLYDEKTWKQVYNSSGKIVRV